MMTQQRTFYSADAVRKVADMLKKQGYKELSFWEHRVPRGTKSKKIIKLRQWHGEWAGYQTHTAAILYC